MATNSGSSPNEQLRLSVSTRATGKSSPMSSPPQMRAISDNMYFMSYLSFT